MANPIKPRCECVMWRQDSRRCELWLLGGVAYLRVYDGTLLVLQEPAPAGLAYARAQELRPIASAGGTGRASPQPAIGRATHPGGAQGRAAAHGR